MRKKFTLFIALLLVCVGAWAQKVVTTINTEKYYTLECQSGYAHSTTRFIGVTDAGVINGQSSSAACITFEAGADAGSYYIKVGEKYLNHDGTNISAGTEKSTAWILGTVGQTVTFKYPSATKYLNNVASDNIDKTVENLKANNHPDGPNSGNACSTWQMREYDNAELVPELESNATIEDAWTTASWKQVTENVPADVVAAESGQYADKESDVWSAVGKLVVPAGCFEATLIYQGGANRLDILGVDLLDGVGAVVAHDYHFGFSGGNKVNNTYTLEVPADGTYTLRYWVTFCAEANTSNGKINLKHMTRDVAIQALEGAIAAAQAKVAAMSDALGYYSTDDAEVEGKLKAVVDFKDAMSSETTIMAIIEQTAAAEAITASFKLNLPERGKFYRFKHPTEDAYMLSDEYSDTRLAMGALESNKVSSIFYYDENGALLSYHKGQYLPKAAGGGDWTCLAVGSDAPKATFGVGSQLGCLGFYIGDADDRAYYSGRKNYVDAGGSFGANDGYDWVVEEVTTLPVTVGEMGYATLYAPVALSIPAEGVKAYTGALNGDVLTLTEVSGTIPANTGVVLKATAGTYDFAVADAAEAVESALVGTVAAEVAKATAFALQSDADAENGVAFKGTTENLGGFMAYLNIEDAAIEAVNISLGTTYIDKEQLTMDNASVVIYDLTGRRVEKMEKGIYIVGGKKVVIK